MLADVQSFGALPREARMTLGILELGDDAVCMPRAWILTIGRRTLCA
jgi:hypothetical protein